MATALENLRAARDALSAQYAALVSDATQAGGKPNASGDGMVDHLGFRQQIWRELQEIDKAIASLVASGADYGEVTSEGRG